MQREHTKEVRNDACLVHGDAVLWILAQLKQRTCC